MGFDDPFIVPSCYKDERAIWQKLNNLEGGTTEQTTSLEKA